MAWLTAGCVRCSRSAAREKLRSAATARKTCNEGVAAPPRLTRGRRRTGRRQPCYTAGMPSRDAQWIIGTILAAAVALGVQNAAIRDDLRDVRADVRDVRADVRALDARLTTEIANLRAEVTEQIRGINSRMDALDGRLRNVEIAFGKIDQRLLTIERVLLPAQPPE